MKIDAGGALVMDIASASSCDQILLSDNADIVFNGGTLKINYLDSSASTLNETYELVSLDDSVHHLEFDNLVLDTTDANLPWDSGRWSCFGVGRARKDVRPVDGNGRGPCSGAGYRGPVDFLRWRLGRLPNSKNRII